MPRIVSSLVKAWRFFDASELFVLSFAGAILAGALTLMLPGCTTGGIRFIDALFTSTSAVCVTGLTAVDTGSSFTRPGQVMILGLIQAGGLGIMTFSVFLALFAGRRVSLRDRLIVRDSFVPYPSGQTLPLVRQLFLITVSVELTGALLLFLFTPEHRVFESAFHSISAFCNAGFSPRPNNLVDYRYSFGVNLTVCGLIVVGGLGFFNVVELLRIVRRRGSRQPSLHSRLVWLVTGLLIVVGAAGFALLEAGNTLRGESSQGVFLTSLFQSITPRTAGFQTVDFARLSNPTLFIIVLLMFVGASPGSTGGGIKTTTLGILVAMAWSRLRGVDHVLLFKRTVPGKTVSKAVSVLVLGFTVITLAVLALAVTETGSRPFGASEIRFLELLFEVTSAFGTVGLSTGITPRLTSLGKFGVILVMFIGRVGPLTLATAVGRSGGRAKFRYSEENVMVG